MDSPYRILTCSLSKDYKKLEITTKDQLASLAGQETNKLILYPKSAEQNGFKTKDHNIIISIYQRGLIILRSKFV